MALPWCSKVIQRILCYYYCACLKKNMTRVDNADGFYNKSQDQVHFSTDKIDKVIFILGHCPNSIHLDGKNI